MIREMTENSDSPSKSSISSSSSPAAVITDVERELAQNALTEFKKGSYTVCLAYLNELVILRPKDVKVMHNRVIAEYYRTELKKTEPLAKSLNAMCNLAATTPDAPSSSAIDDVESCVVRYNQAILLYHKGQYEAALDIINRLFNYVEPLEESLAHKVCLLLIELYIATKNAETALTIVNYVESQFVSTDPGKLSGAVEKDAVTSKAAKEQKERRKETSDAATDEFRIKLLKYKARLYLMLQQPKLSKREWKTLVSLGTQVNISSIFLKANLECARGNYKKAMKLLNSGTTEAWDFNTRGESAAVLYYNNMACIHQERGKPNLAAFYFRKALEENARAVESVKTKDSDSSSRQPLWTLGGNKHHELMFNLGVSLLHAGQPTKAFDCLTEAAQKLQNSPHLWLRMAECCIQCHKPNNAVEFDIAKRREDLVQKVVGTGRHRKIILASALSKDTRYHAESVAYAIPQPTLEFGMLCLKNALFTLSMTEEEARSLSVSCPAVSATTTGVSISLSGGFAAAAATAAATAPAESDEPPLTSQLSAGMTQDLHLRIAILAASSYVSLCLGDYIVALEHAKAMLIIDKLPGAYKMLASLYAAESLILMDKINEAMEYLKPHNIQDLNVSLPMGPPFDSPDKDKDKDEILPKANKSWFPSSLPTAKAIIKYNLAVAYAIRGELDKSGEILKQVWLSKGPDCDVPIHVIMLALYIELQLGHADVSRSIVKQHCPQYW